MSSSARVIIADDAIFTGIALHHILSAFPRDMEAAITVIASRINASALSGYSKVLARLMPEDGSHIAHGERDIHIYAGEFQHGKEQIKDSVLIREAVNYMRETDPMHGFIRKLHAQFIEKPGEAMGWRL